MILHAALPRATPAEVGSMSGQRLRRWHGIEPTPGVLQPDPYLTRIDGCHQRRIAARPISNWSPPPLLRRWPSIKPTLGERLVSAGMLPVTVLEISK